MFCAALLVSWWTWIVPLGAVSGQWHGHDSVPDFSKRPCSVGCIVLGLWFGLNILSQGQGVLLRDMDLNRAYWASKPIIVVFSMVLFLGANNKKWKEKVIAFQFCTWPIRHILLGNLYLSKTIEFLFFALSLSLSLSLSFSISFFLINLSPFPYFVVERKLDIETWLFFGHFQLELKP